MASFPNRLIVVTRVELRVSRSKRKEKQKLARLSRREWSARAHGLRTPQQQKAA